MYLVRNAQKTFRMLQPLLLVCLGILQEAYSFEWKDPLLTKDELATYRTLSEGKDLGVKKELKVVVHEREYEVTFSVIDKEGRSEFAAAFTRGTGFGPVRYSRKKTDASRDFIIQEEIQLKDNPNYSRNTCPLFGNLLAFRGLCRHTQQTRLEYPCLFPGGSSFLLLLKTTSGQRIHTPAGPFDCLRIEETVEMQSLIKGVFGTIMGVLPIRIVPKTTYWFCSEYPHVLVRRDGVAGPPPHDYIVTDELIRYE